MSADYSLTLDTVRLAMGLEELRARIAAQNIATANIPNSASLYLDSDAALGALRSARTDPDLFRRRLAETRLDEQSPYLHASDTLSAAPLDAQVAELSAASGKYQALADGVSRQFALMQLAIKGGR